MFKNLTITLYMLLAGPVALAGGTYQTPDEFLKESFADTPPEPAVVWLSGQRKTVVEQILGHRYPTLRIRYWRDGARSAWIREEVGKEQPITVGVVVNRARIDFRAYAVDSRQ